MVIFTHPPSVLNVHLQRPSPLHPAIYQLGNLCLANPPKVSIAPSYVYHWAIAGGHPAYYPYYEQKYARGG